MVRGRALNTVDANGAEVLILLKQERSALGELENGEKRGDDLLGGGIAVEQIPERHMGTRRGNPIDRGDGELDGNAVRSDVFGFEQEGLALTVQVRADDRQALNVMPAR